MKSFSIYRFGKRNAPVLAAARDRKEAAFAAESDRTFAQAGAAEARASLLADFLSRHESAARRTPRQNRRG